LKSIFSENKEDQESLLLEEGGNCMPWLHSFAGESVLLFLTILSICSIEPVPGSKALYLLEHLQRKKKTELVIDSNGKETLNNSGSILTTIARGRSVSNTNRTSPQIFS
jgi:hypothetical protein